MAPDCLNPNSTPSGTGSIVDRDYDIFEILPGESLLWRMCVHGTQNVAKALEELGKQTPNECFAINIGTKEVIARVNDKRSRGAHLGSGEGG